MNVTASSAASVHPFLDGKPKRMLIDGKWVEAASGKTFDTVNPATGEVLAQVAEGDAEDIDRAVAAARRAFDGPWRKFKPYERQALLLRLADLVERHFEELAALDTLDMGAPIQRTRGNKLRVLGMLRYYAGLATAIHGETTDNSLPGEFASFTLKEPVGVVGAIIPWNGPLASTIWKIGPALATGCTVVLKPAEEAPLTPLRLAELCLEAGVPAGVVNVVPGFGETAGAALAAHPGVDKVAFTGSHLTGQKIVQAERRQPQARVAGARRQVARHRLRRRRSRRGGARRRHGGVRQLRPDLLRRHAAVRREGDLRGVRRARRRLRPDPPRRRRARPGDRRSARWSRPSSSSGSPAISPSAGRRARGRSRAASG